METLEQLKAIKNNQPKDGTAQIYDGEYWKFEGGNYYRWTMVCDIQGWYIDTEPSDEARLMSSIGFTIEMMEAQNNLKDRISSIKGRLKKVTD